jgi:hypothetical protein
MLRCCAEDTVVDEVDDVDACVGVGVGGTIIIIIHSSTVILLLR